ALDASYGSLEAFTRAFRRAFRVSPSLYRRMGATHFHLPAPNGLHFWSPSQDPRSKGANTMDLFDRFAGAEAFHTRRLLEQAAKLTDEQLDRPLNGTAAIFGWCEPDQNLREILERIVQTKEAWASALAGTKWSHDSGPTETRTPQALLARFEQ